MLQLDAVPTGEGVQVKAPCYLIRQEAVSITQEVLIWLMCFQADRTADRLTGSMMELQTLQEALKVEIQIHQVGFHVALSQSLWDQCEHFHRGSFDPSADPEMFS